MRRFGGTRRLAWALSLLLGTASLHVLASPQHYSIAPGQLADALDRFGQQSGLQLIYRSTLADKQVSPGFNGQGSAEQALAAILQGTGLVYERVDARMFVLHAADATQSAPEAPTSNTAPRTHTFPTMLVTAQKRPELERDVPISMASIDPRTYAKAGYNRMADFVSLVPGVSLLDASPGDGELTMRGISSGLGFNPVVAVTIDDVPFGSSNDDTHLPDLDPQDIERIEVLRGPQGTLYGSNSLGGLFKYVTRSPSPGDDFGSLQLGASRLTHGSDGYTLRANRNFSLSPYAALWISAAKREDPGAIDSADGRHDLNQGFYQSARVAWRWQPTATVDLNLEAIYQSLDQDANGVVDVDIDGNLLYQPWQQSRVLNSDRYRIDNRLFIAHADVDFDWARLTSITGYGKMSWHAWQDVGYTTVAQAQAQITGDSSLGTVVNNWDRTWRFSQEFRLSSPTGDDARANWMLGAFYSRLNASTLQYFYAVDAAGQNAGYPVLLRESNLDQRSEVALFANSNIHISARVDLQLGYRYSWHGYHGGGLATGLLYSEPVSDFSASHESVGTYQLSPKWRISDDWTAYLRISTGYRPGGSNSPYIDVPQRYHSDKLTSFELGIKGSPYSDLILEASVFHIDWHDIQLELVDETSGSSYYANGTHAESDGVELNLDGRFARAWSYALSGAYTRAVLTADIGGAGLYAKRGDRLPYSAPLSLQARLRRDISIGNNTAYWQIGGQYTGERQGEFPDSADGSRFVADGYATARLEAGYQRASWQLTVYLDNVTDHQAWVMMRSRGDNQMAVPLSPRRIGMTWTLAY